MKCPQCKDEGTIKMNVPNPYNIGPPTNIEVVCGKCNAYFDNIVAKMGDYITNEKNEINTEFKNWIIEAYCFLRKNNTSIPDDVLDFMKEASLEALEKK